MKNIQAYYECPKCKRKSDIVRLDKRCVFCEKEKRDEEYSGDDSEFYEGCYVPERDC